MLSVYPFYFMAGLPPLLGPALFLLVLIIISVYISYGYMSRRISQTVKQTAAARKTESDLLQAKLEMQEQTIIDVSKNIHDNIGQKLCLARFQIMQARLKGIPTLPDTEEIIAEAMEDLRELSRSLSADRVEKQGLISAIRYDLALLEKTGGFKTTLEIKGESFFAEAKTEVIIYRIVQEALQNIIRHSGAREIRVMMQYEPTELCVVIKDNGNSDMSATVKDVIPGNGLKNMEDRAKGLGGVCFIDIDRGGSTVELDVPISPVQAA